MIGNRTALGVSPGLKQANFVFGSPLQTIGVPFWLAKDLHRADSIAQEHLDFIQKLHSEQSFPGEYFSEIHLGDIRGDDALGAVAHGRRMISLLAEQISQWISSEQLDLQFHQHTSNDVNTRINDLLTCEALPGILSSDTSGLRDAYSLWSLNCINVGDVSKSKVFKKFQAIDYPEMSASIADHYLDKYKNDTIASFSKTRFHDAAIENARQHLIQLANISRSGKDELLACRESILEMLEQQSLSNAQTPEVSLAGSSLVRATSHAEVSSSGNTSVLPDHNEFFKAPKFSVIERLPQSDTNKKTWREPDFRKSAKRESWLFRIVIILGLIGVVYAMQRL